MAFKIRRGTNAERLTITPAEGELIYTTDTKKTYIGDGSTVGGNPVDSTLPITVDGNDLYLIPSNLTIIGNRDSAINGKLLIWNQAYNNAPFAGPISIRQYHNTADSNNVMFYRARGTGLAQTSVQDGDKIIDLNFQAWDGDSIETVASISTVVSGVVSNGIVPGTIRFNVHDSSTAGLAGVKLVTEMDQEGYLRANKIASILTDTNLSIESNGTGRIKINNLNWPTSDGSSGNYLTTNGAGELQWSAPLNLTGYATTTYVDTAISNIIDGAPNLLNTLNELAAAVADDANFAASTTTALGNRVRFDDVQTLTPTQKLVAQSNIGLTPAALQSNWTQTDNTASDFIKNKPTIPAAQVASDWNATTGVSAIANKPTIPSFSAVGQDILPTTDVTYDLGSPSKRFRDLYLSGSTIDLGGKTLSISGGTLSVGGNKFGELGNVVGVAITQFYNNTVYIRLDVGSDAETIANSIVKGDILKLDPDGGYAQIPQLTVVSNNGGIVDTNNTAFKDYLITVAQTGPGSAQNIFFDLVKPIPSDINQLQDADGLLGGGGTANTGDITFTGDNIGSTTDIVTIEVDGGEGAREFTFGSDGRSLRAQISMPQGAKLNFGADATALGAPDSSGSTDKIRLWDFQGSNPSGYNYAIGAEGGGIWFSTDVNNGTGGFSFYSQNNRKFKIRDDGTVDLYNHILPDDNNIIDLGSQNTKFRNVYAAGVTQSNQSATSCPVNVDTVVYTATAQYQHAIKIFAMVEGNVDGEGSNWHTQACDIIAVRSYNNNTVFVTTYGVTYTSTAAFATFDGQWNATTNRIEITCRPVSTNNNVVVSIHATEITSQD